MSHKERVRLIVMEQVKRQGLSLVEAGDVLGGCAGGVSDIGSGGKANRILERTG